MFTIAIISLIAPAGQKPPRSPTKTAAVGRCSGAAGRFQRGQLPSIHGNYSGKSMTKETEALLQIVEKQREDAPNRAKAPNDAGFSFTNAVRFTRS